MRYCLLISALFAAPFLFGACVTSSVGEPEQKPRMNEALLARESAAIKESFTVIAKSMVQGDADNAYKFLTTQEQTRQKSVDDFKKEYEKNKLGWQAMFKGAYLKHIGVEDASASAVVIWGTGESGLIMFIKEDNIWRIDDMRGPAMIIQQ